MATYGPILVAGDNEGDMNLMEDFVDTSEFVKPQAHLLGTDSVILNSQDDSSTPPAGYSIIPVSVPSNSPGVLSSIKTGSYTPANSEDPHVHA